MRMYRNNVSKAEISKNLEIPESTIRSVISRNLDNFNNYLEKKGGARNIKCTSQMREYFDELLSANCTRTIKSLQLSTLDKFGVKLSLSTIQRNIKAINFSLKQTSVLPGQRNSDQNIEARYAYSLRFNELAITYRRSKMIFVDETGFNVSMRRGRGWSKVNTPANTTVPSIRTRNFSVCAAITSNGPLHHEILSQAYNTRCFLNFISDLMRILRQGNMGSCVIIMDNASIHKNPSIKDLVEYNGHRLLFLPPYSPFLNPIENCFSKWKGYVRSTCCTNEEELLREVEVGIRKITNDDCEGYYENMLHYLDLSRNRSHITE